MQDDGHGSSSGELAFGQLVVSDSGEITVTIGRGDWSEVAGEEGLTVVEAGQERVVARSGESMLVQLRSQNMVGWSGGGCRGLKMIGSGEGGQGGSGGGGGEGVKFTIKEKNGVTEEGVPFNFEVNIPSSIQLKLNIDLKGSFSCRGVGLGTGVKD